MSAALILACATLLGAPLSKEEILGQADARIQQHRTGEVALKLIGPDGEAVPAGPEARIEQTNHAFLFGCNIFKLGRCKTPEDNAAYEKHFAELLNFATVPFYWWGYEKAQGKPDDARTEEITRWCKAHGIITKGHPLAWNYGDPPWLPADPDTVMIAQFSRILRCTRRFAGDIDIWDVVNEATAYDRETCWGRSPKLTRAIREMGVGRYVRSAFKAARLGNPDATLIINDYRTEEDYAAKVLDELVDLERKPYYDVIGIQSHQHGGAWPVEKIWAVCERFAAYGKPLHFTENTILSGPPGWELKQQSSDPDFKWASTPEGEARQAKQVVAFYTVLFSHPAVEAITWWDFTDQGAWQSAPAGFLREDLTPKPAYVELKELVKGKWWTQTSAPVGDQGEVRFRGFFGDYRITIGSGDQQRTGSFSFDRTTSGAIEVKLK